MKEFCLRHGNIKLKIICDQFIEEIIKKHFTNHVSIDTDDNNRTYTLVISEKIDRLKGSYFRMVDKWFDNATLDCYIDNNNKLCYATNFKASNYKNKELLIQYFAANVFNRLLELDGYIGIHSSCVEYNNNGIMFVAERYNGKTISMLNLMDNGFNFVTNDKIALKRENDTIFGYGISQPVSIRLGPAFCSQPENKKYVDIANTKGIKPDDKDIINGNKLILSEHELVKLNGVEQTLETPIKYIIRPFYDPYVNESVFAPIKQEETFDLLLSQYMPLVHETTYFLRQINVGSKNDCFELFKSISNLESYFCSQNENTNSDFVNKVRKLVSK